LEAPKFVPLYTVENYKRWSGDWELIEGVAVAMSPSPSWKHQRVTFLLAKEIEEELSDCPCSVCLEVDWIVDEQTVVRPDLAVVYGEVGNYLKRAPSVVFEVVSKSTAFKDETIKFELYQREKVNYYQNYKRLGSLSLKATSLRRFLRAKRESLLWNLEIAA